MNILWSFSQKSLVKFRGNIFWEPLHDPVIIQIYVILSCVIKGLYRSLMNLLILLWTSNNYVLSLQISKLLKLPRLTKLRLIATHANSAAKTFDVRHILTDTSLPIPMRSPLNAGSAVGASMINQI